MALKKLEEFLEKRRVYGVPLLIWFVFFSIVYLRMTYFGVDFMDIIDQVLGWSMGSLVMLIMIGFTAGLPFVHHSLRFIKYGKF